MSKLGQVVESVQKYNKFVLEQVKRARTFCHVEWSRNISNFILKKYYRFFDFAALRSE